LFEWFASGNCGGKGFLLRASWCGEGEKEGEEMRGINKDVSARVDSVTRVCACVRDP